MDYRERLQDYLEIINHAQDTCEYHEDSFSIPIEIQGDTIFISWLDGEYDYMIVSSDEENNTFITIDDGVDELVYKRVALNTKEQFINLCKEIEDRVLDMTIKAAHAYFYRSYIEKYVTDFAQRLKEEWKCFKDVSLSSLPILITEQDPHDDNGNYGNIEKAGTYKPYSGLITVNSVRRTDKEENERTARHEVIHYMLSVINLNYKDDSPAFWFFATIYDAHPYAEMTDENKIIFDALMKGYEADRDTFDSLLLHVVEKANEKVDEDLNIGKR